MATDDYILNAVAIATGGGMQKTLSLIEAISGIQEYSSTTTVIVRESSHLHQRCLEQRLNFHAIKNGNIKRFLFEVSTGTFFKRCSVVFNVGGLPTIGSIGKNLNIGECAYSNLFYPEIPFWSNLNGVYALRAKAIDSIRKYLLTKLDYWVFQTDAIRVRAINLYDFPPDRCSSVKTAPSTLVCPERVNQKRKNSYLSRFGDSYTFLALAGAQPNKRLHLIPKVAKHMVQSGVHDFCFVLTLDENATYARSVLNLFQRLGISEHVVNIGPVDYEDVPSLIDAVGAVCLFSVLESFSNNFVEAWKMTKPLIVTDADWSREAAKDAAIYVDPQDTESTAKALCQLISDISIGQEVVRKGRENLSEYNTATSRTHEYYRIFRHVKEAGPCPPDRKPRFENYLHGYQR